MTKVTFQWIEPTKLRDVWPIVRKGLEETISKAPGGWIPEDIYSEVLTGQAVLHLGIVEDHCRGFIVSKTLEGIRGKTLLIWVLYSDWNGRNILQDNMDEVSAWARNIGANRIQFQSPRRGWERVAESLGFHQTQVIYEYEL